MWNVPAVHGGQEPGEGAADSALGVGREVEESTGSCLAKLGHES